MRGESAITNVPAGSALDEMGILSCRVPMKVCRTEGILSRGIEWHNGAKLEEGDARVLGFDREDAESRGIGMVLVDTLYNGEFL